MLLSGSEENILREFLRTQKSKPSSAHFVASDAPPQSRRQSYLADITSDMKLQSHLTPNNNSGNNILTRSPFSDKFQLQYGGGGTRNDSAQVKCVFELQHDDDEEFIRNQQMIQNSTLKTTTNNQFQDGNRSSNSKMMFLDGEQSSKNISGGTPRVFLQSRKGSSGIGIFSRYPQQELEEYDTVSAHSNALLSNQQSIQANLTQANPLPSMQSPQYHYQGSSLPSVNKRSSSAALYNTSEQQQQGYNNTYSNNLTPIIQLSNDEQLKSINVKGFLGESHQNTIETHKLSSQEQNSQCFSQSQRSQQQNQQSNKGTITNLIDQFNQQNRLKVIGMKQYEQIHEKENTTARVQKHNKATTVPMPQKARRNSRSKSPRYEKSSSQQSQRKRGQSINRSDRSNSNKSFVSKSSHSAASNSNARKVNVDAIELPYEEGMKPLFSFSKNDSQKRVENQKNKVLREQRVSQNNNSHNNTSNSSHSQKYAGYAAEESEFLSERVKASRKENVEIDSNSVREYISSGSRSNVKENNFTHRSDGTYFRNGEQFVNVDIRNPAQRGFQGYHTQEQPIKQQVNFKKRSTLQQDQHFSNMRKPPKQNSKANVAHQRSKSLLQKLKQDTTNKGYISYILESHASCCRNFRKELESSFSACSSNNPCNFI